MLTKRRITTSLKTKTNQDCQKIVLYWSYDNQGVKKEIYIQTGRRGGDGKLGWRGYVARQQLAGWVRRQVDRRPHIHVQISQEKQLGSETGFQCGKLTLQNLWL